MLHISSLFIYHLLPSTAPEPVTTDAQQLTRMPRNAISQLSHKRAAANPSTAASMNQRRKLLHDSMAARLQGQRRGITTTAQAHIPSEPHITRRRGISLPSFNLINMIYWLLHLLISMHSFIIKTLPNMRRGSKEGGRGKR